MTMSENFSGEDLLQVFKDLKVQLFNYTNVVKAWFDTDDKDMKNLLSWMCGSLTAENYMPPLELAEFNNIETPLTGRKYEQEMTRLKLTYPGILDVDFTALDIEILEDELNLAEEEEQRLDNLITLYEELQKNLQKEGDEKTRKEITTSLKLRDTQEHCYNLAEKLDNVYTLHYQQLQEYGDHLYNFELNPDQNFINNMDPEVFQKKFNILTSQLMPILENSISLSSSTTVLSNRTYFSLEDTLPNDINNMKYRIMCSLQNYMISKIEREKVSEMLNYLYNLDLNNLISGPDRSLILGNMDAKEDTRNRMYGVLQEIASKVAEHQTSITKLKYTQHELEINQSKLESLSRIEEMSVEILSYFMVLNILYTEEMGDIEKIDSYFKNIYKYVKGRDLQNCIKRTDCMNQIIKEYNSRPQNNDFKLIQSIVKIISNEESVSLERAFQIISEFRRELKKVESKSFTCNMDYRSLGNEVKNDINVLQSFLKCGPTTRIIVIPFELQKVFRETEETLKKQVASVKTAVELAASMKKRFQVKWEMYRRQLWMYFYADPQKLKLVLHEIQEECAKSKPQIEEK